MKLHVNLQLYSCADSTMGTLNLRSGSGLRFAGWGKLLERQPAAYCSAHCNLCELCDLCDLCDLFVRFTTTRTPACYSCSQCSVGRGTGTSF